MAVASVHHLVPDWYKTAEGKEVLASLLDKNTKQRRPFTILVEPVFSSPAAQEVFAYKLFVCGEKGVGKTSVVAKLSANKFSRTYSVTVGIKVSVVFWPARLTQVDRIVLFKLFLWDAADSYIKKSPAVLQQCTDKVDGIIYMFSFDNKLSFKDLAFRMAATSPKNTCEFLLGTKLDLQSENEVTLHDVSKFKSSYSCKVLSMPNIVSLPNTSAAENFDDVAPALDRICEELWRRDQAMAKNTPQPSNPSGK